MREVGLTSIWEQEPVLAVCGWSGSGKTTLLEQALGSLTERGLRVAVVKHDAHGLDFDREGKDSDRLFNAGADVHLRGPGELIWRMHESPHRDLSRAVGRLLENHDFVLVEGHKETPLPKVWCSDRLNAAPPDGLVAVRAVLPWDGRRCELLLAEVDRRFEESRRKRPLFGGLLIGGLSRRMGSPKHLIELAGKTMLEKVFGVLEPGVDRVVLLGSGEVPPVLSGLKQLPDTPDAGAGPLAALVTALRWAPRAGWLVVACDMPKLTPEALAWLERERGPGRWVVLPKDSEGRPEPLLAVYEPQSGHLLEGLVARGCRAPRVLAEFPQIHTPAIPPNLAPAWVNVNHPEDLGNRKPLKEGRDQNQGQEGR
ncbi:MAG: molybdopterin-guanine dinucleotide biosynthesis protein B [Thermoanaerobaculales bacterium]|nr:molybdopterin-guanine dinucleotide biosynthesis protein B [Thermoanaerobaculales bacterium]